MVALTSSRCVGPVVPMPTLPVSLTMRMRSGRSPPAKNSTLPVFLAPRSASGEGLSPA
jgi:hypothetical protein